MKQQKFITSHRFRVSRAKRAIQNSPERISIFDREAYVEFYLLEDIVRLYEYRLEAEKRKVVTTRAGELGKNRNIEKFSAIINIFKSAIEIAWSEITSGNYKNVWKAINEHALMIAAGSMKNLPELRQLAVALLKELSEEALAATQENAEFNEQLDDLESHEANVRSVRGLPSAEEIDELVRAAEVAIPDERTNRTRNVGPVKEEIYNGKKDQRRKDHCGDGRARQGRPHAGKIRRQI